MGSCRDALCLQSHGLISRKGLPVLPATTTTKPAVKPKISLRDQSELPSLSSRPWARSSPTGPHSQLFQNPSSAWMLKSLRTRGPWPPCRPTDQLQLCPVPQTMLSSPGVAWGKLPASCLPERPKPCGGMVAGSHNNPTVLNTRHHREHKKVSKQPWRGLRGSKLSPLNWHIGATKKEKGVNYLGHRML